MAPTASDRLLLNEQTVLLFSDMPAALLSSFIVALVTASTLGFATAAIEAWLCAHVILTIARYGLYLAFLRRRQTSTAALQPWLRRYAPLAATSGLVWGSLPFAASGVAVGDALFIGVVLAGVAAGALVTMSALRRMYALYAGVLLGTFASWATFFSEPPEPALGFLTLIFYATLLAASRQYNGQWTKAFHLSRSNRDLLEQVRAERNDLRAAQNTIDREQQVAAYVMESIVKPFGHTVPGIRHYQRGLHDFVGDVTMFDLVEGNRFRLLVGDATGHGLSAALAAIPVSQTFSTINQKGLELEILLTELNRNLSRLLPSSMFMAAALIELRPVGPAACHARVWNGGLDDLLVVRGSGRIERIPSRNLALGVLSAGAFAPQFQTLRLGRDDRLYAYSDGITEANNVDGQAYGRARLADTLAGARERGQPLAAALADFEDFMRGSAQDDDLTIVEIHAGALAPYLAQEPNPVGSDKALGSAGA